MYLFRVSPSHRVLVVDEVFHPGAIHGPLRHLFLGHLRRIHLMDELEHVIKSVLVSRQKFQAGDQVCKLSLVHDRQLIYLICDAMIDEALRILL